jgi:hypothetical protein
VHPFDPVRIGSFMQAAYKLLDAAGGAAAASSHFGALKALLGSSSGQQDLKRLYKRVRSDHNCVSMSLFSSPCPLGPRRGELSVSLSADGSTGMIQPPAPRFGWLHTGDSALARDAYRRAWLNYFKPLLSHVAVLVTPHHGSRHNFHGDIMTASSPSLALACASRSNGYGHPARVVARAARASRAAYHQVDEWAESSVVGCYLG